MNNFKAEQSAYTSHITPIVVARFAVFGLLLLHLHRAALFALNGCEFYSTIVSMHILVQSRSLAHYRIQIHMVHVWKALRHDGEYLSAGQPFSREGYRFLYDLHALALGQLRAEQGSSEGVVVVLRAPKG